MECVEKCRETRALLGAPLTKAYHEAGHCIALALSFKVVRVDLEYCRVRRRDDPIGHWSQSIVACAGPVSEQRYARYPPNVIGALRRSTCAPDYCNAERWLLQLDGSVTLKQCENMAASLGAEHWSAITRVARALAEAGEFSGIDLGRLWRGRD
jgi:hypothetical protein